MISTLQALKPYLTDFLGNELVFQQRFEEGKNSGIPIKTALELGVYRIGDNPDSLLPGQSTKTLFILGDVYGLDLMVSLDIDDCSHTIEVCKKWAIEQGVNIPNHKFVQSDSMLYDAKKDFPNGIDLIFLDTNHDSNYPETLGYENSGGAGYTYNEICKYAPLLSKHGSLFIHDTKMFYVQRAFGWNTQGAIERFIFENKERFWFKEHDTNYAGLGEIRRCE